MAFEQQKTSDGDNKNVCFFYFRPSLNIKLAVVKKKLMSVV